MNENTILHSVPAAGELHKVPGFDPLKHLRRTVDAQGRPVMRLEPRYQRLWFRLACPKGRMLLTPLRLTDQLAIFEAKVFFHGDDAVPASSFTANKTVQETPRYIRAAQDEALAAALDNAGFGIQLCDVTRASGDGDFPPPVPPVLTGGQTEPAQGQTEPASAQKDPPAAQTEKSPAKVERASDTAAVPNGKEDGSTPMAETVPALEREQEAPEAAPHEEAVSEPKLTTLLNFPGAEESSAVPQEADDGGADYAAADPSASDGAEVVSFVPDGAAPGQAEAPAPAVPLYTEDMPVEEICQVMTMEEAQSVAVTKGTCKGWTMGQVAEKRPSSLRFYLSGFGACSNIQLAAATLLMQSIEIKKAG